MSQLELNAGTCQLWEQDGWNLEFNGIKEVGVRNRFMLDGKASVIQLSFTDHTESKKQGETKGEGWRT